MKKIAIVQSPPVLCDRDATVARAVTLAKEAIDAGAALVAFPEAFVPGYPTWAWRLRPGGDMALSGELHNALRQNAVNLAAGHLAPLTDLAKARAVDILCGIDEVESEHSGATIYNSYVHIDAGGKIANVHRKIMPTNPERMVWGFGDGRGLRVVDTPVGRVGSLLCWENFMPLARMALYAQEIDLFLAPTWDSSAGWTETMGHIAREGRCYVASICSAMHGSDIPAGLPGREQLFKDEEVINPGNSCIIAPGGEMLVAPVSEATQILYAEIDPEIARSARRTLDVGGHYNRPDILKFEVNREIQRAAHFKD